MDIAIEIINELPRLNEKESIRGKKPAQNYAYLPRI